MSLRAVVRALCWLAILVPLTVTSTPPSMMLRSYRLSGTLQNSRGDPLAGATVAFATRCGGEYLILGQVNGCTCSQGKRQGTTRALTADNGAFALDLVSCELFDSLAVAVVDPDTVITDKVLAVRNSHEDAWTEQVPSEDKSYFFCATSTGYTTVRVGVIYSFSSQTVTAP